MSLLLEITVQASVLDPVAATPLLVAPPLTNEETND